jgi:hypothetical protein
MKTQLRKPVRSNASYTDQYKQEALELWRASELWRTDFDLIFTACCPKSLLG